MVRNLLLNQPELFEFVTCVSTYLYKLRGFLTVYRDRVYGTTQHVDVMINGTN